MGYREIPIRRAGRNFTQRTTLDGIEYGLRFRWSQLEQRWYFDLLDSEGDLIAGCIKIIVNRDLLYSRRGHAGVPQGELRAIDGSSAPVDPGLEELGDAIPLIYREAEG